MDLKAPHQDPSAARTRLGRESQVATGAWLQSWTDLFSPSRGLVLRWRTTPHCPGAVGAGGCSHRVCQGCVLNKQQFLGVRVLSSATIYPEKLGSADLILPLGTLGGGHRHIHPSTNMPVPRESQFISPWRVGGDHTSNPWARTTEKSGLSLGWEGSRMGLAWCRSLSGRGGLGTAAHTTPCHTTSHHTAQLAGRVQLEEDRLPPLPPHAATHRPQPRETDTTAGSSRLLREA